MIYLLVGHRGVGKSSLLKRMKAYDPSAHCWDLDEEIEKLCGKNLSHIFESEGEAAFRKIERKVLNQWLQSHQHKATRNHYMALGAGFEGDGFQKDGSQSAILSDFEKAIPPELVVIWVRRTTDSLGRTLMNRPPLPPKGEKTSEYKEFLKRFKKREQRYAQWAHDEITLIEGLDFPNPWESMIFNPSPSSQTPQTPPSLSSKPSPHKVTPHGQITLFPQHMASYHFLHLFVKKYEAFFSHFELRNDLLCPQQIQWARELIPAEKLILSHRTTHNTNQNDNQNTMEMKIDWALELGEPKVPCHVISLHKREKYGGGSVKDCCQQLEKYFKFNGSSKHLKLAISIENFEELWEAHQWWKKHPENRSFLPRSQSGRWSWYRMRQKPYMKFNFVRLGDSSSCKDQPLLLDWLRGLDNFKNFAAVLGQPVESSHTPIEHDEYFRKENIPVLRISMEEKELDPGLSILKDLGLICAAVTSPLKKSALHFCDQLSSVAQESQSVNTLFFDEKDKKIVGHNTDIDGLKCLFTHVKSFAIVWGGGGTRRSMALALKALGKKASFYSARTGKPLSSEQTASKMPFEPISSLIWAVGRNRHKKWPSHSPHKVIDLNYTQDSPGLEFAHSHKIPYISGQSMFKAQAKEQRAFWSQWYLKRS